MRTRRVSLLVAAACLPLLATPAFASPGALPAHRSGQAAVTGVVALIEGTDGVQVRTYATTSTAARDALIAQLKTHTEVIAAGPNYPVRITDLPSSPAPSTTTPSITPSVTDPGASPTPTGSVISAVPTATPTDPGTAASSSPAGTGTSAAPSTSPSASPTAPATETPAPTAAPTSAPAPAGFALTDPFAAAQWALPALHAPEALTKAAANPLLAANPAIVAVVDSGVDGSNPDFTGKNGNVVLPGYDFVDSHAGGNHDPNGHGTHVAGIIAAAANNGIGVAGLAQGAKILPVRVMGADGIGDAATIAKGILWAADHGASVINLSLGGAPDFIESGGQVAGDDPELAAITYATAHGALVVAAAGNSAVSCSNSVKDVGPDCGNPIFYPASYPYVTSVAAVGMHGTAAPFSEHNPYVDLAAPGVCILSTYPQNKSSDWTKLCVQAGMPQPPAGYAYDTGTSMASPYVAAAAALTQSYWTRKLGKPLSPAALAHQLQRTATDLGSTGRDDHYGDGLLNPLAALTVTPTDANPDAPVITVPTAALVTRATHQDAGGWFAIVGYSDQVRVTGTAGSGTVTLDQLLAQASGQGRLTAHCFPLTDTKFYVGTTQVSCTAVDASGTVGFASFQLKVAGPGDSTAVPNLPVSRSIGVPVPKVVHAG